MSRFLGATVYPSEWENIPEDIDRFPQRLWDWSDTELTRCITISKAYRALFGPAKAGVVPAPPSPSE